MARGRRISIGRKGRGKGFKKSCWEVSRRTGCLKVIEETRRGVGCSGLVIKSGREIVYKVVWENRLARRCRIHCTVGRRREFLDPANVIVGRPIIEFGLSCAWQRWWREGNVC